MKKPLFPLILFLFLCANQLIAQVGDSGWQEFNRERLRLNRVGMQVLGGWAIANFAISGVGITQSTGETKAFHQMNVGWNLVNITLAGFGYFNALRGETDLDAIQSICEHESIMRIFLFNAGLDLGYIMGGAFLLERSKNVTKNSARLAGFGKSIMLQGGFLMLFDAIMYFAHQQHGKSELPGLISGLSVGPSGIRYCLSF